MSDRHNITVSGTPNKANHIVYQINGNPTPSPTNQTFCSLNYYRDTDTWDKENQYRETHTYEGVEYYSVVKYGDMDSIILYYPIAFPIRDLDVVIKFGNSAPNHNDIEYGLYTTDGNFSPLLFYHHGYIEDGVGHTLLDIDLRDLLPSEDHWIRFNFDGQHNKLLATVKDTDTSVMDSDSEPDEFEVPYSEFELDLNQTCYVGVKSNGEGQEIWLKEITAYWTKAPTTCEISTGSDEYVYPSPVDGTCKVLSDYRTLYSLDSEVSLKKYQGNNESSVALTRKTTNGVASNTEFSFTDSPTPSTAGYGYTFRYNGNLSYEPSETTIDINVKDIPKITWNEPEGKIYYSAEENTLSAILETVNANGEYVRAKNKTVSCKIYNNGITDTTINGVTNNEGVVTITYTPPNDGTYTIRWGFPVTTSDSARYVSKSITKNINVIHKSVTKISVSRGSTVQYYPNTITITATLKNENNATLNATPVEFFYYTSKNNTPISLGVVNTNNRGVATITPSLAPLIDDSSYDTAHPNNTISDFYSVYAVYWGDDYNRDVTSSHYSFKYVDVSVLSLEGEYETELNVKSEVVVSVKLVDGGGVLSGRSLSYSLGVDGGGTVLKSGSVSTNTNGIATFRYTNNTIGNVDSTLTFTFANDVTNGITGTSISFPIHWNKLNTEWVTIEGDGVYETDCKQYCKWTAQLQVVGGSVLSQTSVKREITLTRYDGSAPSTEAKLTNSSEAEYLTGVRNTTTNSSGRIILAPKCNHGDVKAVVKLTLESTDLYNSSTISKTLKWNKIVTVWENVNTPDIGYDSFETECTLYCQWKGRVKGVDSHLFPDMYTRWKIVVTTLNGGTEPGTSLYEPGGVLVPNNQWNNYTHRLTNNGIEDFALMSTYGDIKAVITFYFDGDECYKASNITKTFKWNKIETELTTYDLTHYSTRFTNIEWDSVDSVNPSPGTNTDYVNVKARLCAVNTNTGLNGVKEKPILFTHGNNRLFETTPQTNNDGWILERWTRESTGRSVITVKFEGDHQFKPYTSTMVIITLERIQPKITAEHTVIYPSENIWNFRYNIPFDISCTIEYTVTTDGVTATNPLYPARIEFVFNDVSKGFKTVDQSGTFYINRIRPPIVGELPIQYKYNENDLIDKYLPCIKTYTLTIDKDNPRITLDNLPIIIDSDEDYEAGCDPYMAEAHFYNSIDEPLEGGRLYWLENIGDSDDESVWDFLPPENPIRSGATGLVVKDIPPRSGVRLIKALFETNNWYNGTHQTSYIKWDITRLYGWDQYDGNVNVYQLYGYQYRIPVEEGSVTFDLDCHVPEGLYDLRIDFVGNEGEECQKYADNTLYKGIHRKQGLKFLLRPNEDYNEDLKEFQKEATQQFSVTTALYNIDKREFMDDKLVRTRVNNTVQLNKKTDEIGEVTRHHVNNNVDIRDVVSYYYDQTRKTAKCNLDTYTHTLKITPQFMYITTNGTRYYSQRLDDGVVHFYKDTVSGNGFVHSEISSEEYSDFLTVTYYQYNEFEVTVLAYYLRNHYDKYSEEILMTDVHHNYSSSGVESYYVVVNGEQVPTTREVYEQSQHYNDVIPITNTVLQWKDENNTTLLTCTTNNQGYGTIRYTRNELGTLPVTVGIENHSKYNDQQFPLKFKTIPRKTTVMTNDPNRIYTITLNGQNHTVLRDGVKTTVYNEPCKLNCILKDSDGNPLQGKTVKFKQSSILLGTAVTDENGYCEIPPEETKFYYPTVGKDFMYQCIFYADGIYEKTEEVFTVHNSKQIPRLSLGIDSINGSGKLTDNPTITSNWTCYPDENITCRLELRESEFALQEVTETGNTQPRPLKNRKIKFQILRKNEETNEFTQYGKIIESTTNPNGKTSITFNTQKYGTYKIKATYDTTDKYYTECNNTTTVNLNIIRRPTRIDYIQSNDEDAGWHWNSNHTVIQSSAYLEMGIVGQLVDLSTTDGFELDDQGNPTTAPRYKRLTGQPIHMEWIKKRKANSNNDEVIYGTVNKTKNTDKDGLVSLCVTGGIMEFHDLLYSFEGNDIYEPYPKANQTSKFTLSFERTRALIYKHNATKFEMDKNISIDMKCVYLDSDGREKGIKDIPLKLFHPIYLKTVYTAGPQGYQNIATQSGYQGIPCQGIINENCSGPKRYYGWGMTDANGIAHVKYTFSNSTGCWTFSEEPGRATGLATAFPFSTGSNTVPIGNSLSGEGYPLNFTFTDSNGRSIYPYFNCSLWASMKSDNIYQIPEDSSMNNNKENYHYKTDYTYAKNSEGDIVTPVKELAPILNETTHHLEVHYGTILTPKTFMVNGDCTLSYTFSMKSTSKNGYGFMIGLSESIGRWMYDNKNDTSNYGTPFKMEYQSKTNEFYLTVGGVKSKKAVTFSKDKDYTVTVKLEDGILSWISVGSYKWNFSESVSQFLNKAPKLKFFLFNAFGDDDSIIVLNECKCVYQKN